MQTKMGMGGDVNGCGLCAKYSLFIANFIMFIGGAVLFGLGIWTLVDRSFMKELLGTNLFSGTVYVLIVTSAIVCLVSFFGCFGAAKEVKCLILFYFVIVFLVFVVMLIGGILAYVFREKVVQTMRQEMYSSLRLYGNNRPVTLAWDETQIRLKCCGIESYHDWQGAIPESCCQEAYGGQRKPCVNNPTPFSLHVDGCRNVTTEFIREHANIIASTGISVAILLLFALIFSLILFKSIE